MPSQPPGDSSAPASPSPSEPTTPQPAPEPAPEPARQSRLFRQSRQPLPERALLSPEPGPGAGSWDLRGESPSPLGRDVGSPSGPRSTAGKFRAKELREAARAAIRTAGGAAHRLLTRRHTPERDLGLFLADEEDEKAIGDPLASIAARRMPSGANADTFDLLRLGLALISYLSKQGDKKAEAEAIRFATTPPPPDDPTEETAP